MSLGEQPLGKSDEAQDLYNTSYTDAILSDEIGLNPWPGPGTSSLQEESGTLEVQEESGTLEVREKSGTLEVQEKSDTLEIQDEAIQEAEEFSEELDIDPGATSPRGRAPAHPNQQEPARDHGLVGRLRGARIRRRPARYDDFVR